jgi:hypothetical protein
MDKPFVPSFLPVSAMMMAIGATGAALFFVECDINPWLAALAIPFIVMFAYMEWQDRADRLQIYDNLAVEFTTGAADETPELERRFDRMLKALKE